MERWSLAVDYADSFGLVATTGPEGAIIAHGGYFREDPDRAEVAFMVADDWQGRGIATIMIAHLAAAAEQHGIAQFTAVVLPSNHRMIDVFRQSGFPVVLRSTPGQIEIEFPTSLSPVALARFERREQTAAIAAVALFLRPRSVAVITAAQDRSTITDELWHHLIEDGFTGIVHSVGGRLAEGADAPAYAAVAELPESVDLALIAVAPEQVSEVAAECGAAGVRALLVISAGFADAGEAGRRRQQNLLGICRRSGMRLLGPNCLGVVNTDPDVRLSATYADQVPALGRVGLMSQSAGAGVAMLEAVAGSGLGVSSFVSVGDKADISGNDLLQYWESDPRTDVVALHPESFGNPRRFARLARRVSAGKPIIALTSGRSLDGSPDTRSHVGTLVYGSELAVDALFAQAGVIRVDTIPELLDVTALISSQPLPRGGRVAILTNARGPGILCADACRAEGLTPVDNPINLLAGASAGQYRRTLEILASEDGCDAVIVIFVAAPGTRVDDVAPAVLAASRSTRALTVAAVVIGAQPSSPAPVPSAPGVLTFASPEAAGRALAHAVRYARWRSSPAGSMPEFADARSDQAAAIIAAALSAGEEWLAPEAVTELFRCYGLGLIPTRVTGGIAGALRAAAELDGPVALKALAPNLRHKADAGAVQLGLAGPTAVRRAARQIKGAMARHGQPLQGFVVQPMAHPGVELVIGIVHDQSFGPVVVCGAQGTDGGPPIDVSVRITPLTDLDAEDMLGALRKFSELDGHVDRSRWDIEALKDTLLRLSALAQTHAEIAELDIAPVIVASEGAAIVDARVRLAPAAQRPPLSALRT